MYLPDLPDFSENIKKRYLRNHHNAYQQSTLVTTHNQTTLSQTMPNKATLNPIIPVPNKLCPIRPLLTKLCPIRPLPVKPHPIRPGPVRLCSTSPQYHNSSTPSNSARGVLVPLCSNTWSNSLLSWGVALFITDFYWLLESPVFGTIAVD